MLELRKYIDWTPFFSAWELKGKYPDIFTDKLVGREAKKLFDDARDLLDKVIKEKWIKAKAVIGLWPANATNDDIEIYTDNSRKKTLGTFHCLRQQFEKTGGQPYLSLSDFTAPKDSGVEDYFGGFAVTTGLGLEKWTAKFEKDHDDYNSILIKALADRLAEALAERMHERIRKEFWGYAKDENLDSSSILQEKYQGIRPAPGYPACPDHTEKKLLFELLHATESAGIALTESYAMYPASSVCGLYFSHKDSKYFGLGKIGNDQVREYAQRKEMDVKTIEKWLAPNLNY